eukprot:TCALIF_05287-PA protein Name:"Similar to PAXIP1 PAX-interacting protein 1 (Homo sapiens)" AED:0.10 eAED:0.10 QI:0/0.6/0.5/1/1/1/6/134/1359
MSDPGPQPQPPPAATPTSTTSTTPAPWFADWKFFVSGQIQETVLSILEKGGAVQKSYLTPGVTHCLVGGEADLDGEVSEAADIYEIPVLSQDYVLDTHRTGRWPPQPPYNPLTAGQVLGACRLCLSGLGPEDSRSLWALIRAHGGQVVRELNAKVTHLIARDGLGPKYAAAARHGIPVVTPDWVLDGIRAGQLRDPAVYHPRLLLLPGQVPPPVKKMRKKRVPTVVAPPPPPIPPVSRVPRPVMTDMVTSTPVAMPIASVPVASPMVTAPPTHTNTDAHRDLKPPVCTPLPVMTEPTISSISKAETGLTPSTPVHPNPPVSASPALPVSSAPATAMAPPAVSMAETHPLPSIPPPQAPVIPPSAPTPTSIPPAAVSAPPPTSTTSTSEGLKVSAGSIPRPAPGVIQSQAPVVHAHPTNNPSMEVGSVRPPLSQPMGSTPISSAGQVNMMPQAGPPPQSVPSAMAQQPRMPQPPWPPQTTQQPAGHWNQSQPQFRPPAGPQPPGMPQPQPGWNNGPPEGGPQGQLQWQQQGQGFPPGQGGPMPGQQVIRVPHSSPNASIMSPGAGPNNRMPVPQSVAGQPRPTWSGETHPALAQVPRTPQQLQHLQRLQMQREQQQQMDQTGAMISGPPGPRPAMGPQAIMGQPQVQMGGVPISQQQQQQAQFLQQQAAMQNGSNQKTKVALANMINNRLGQPPTSGGMPMGSPQGMSPQQPMPNQAPNPMGGPPMSGPMGPDGSAAARLQMMNQQLHPHQGGPHPHMIQPGTMYRAPGAPPQGPRFMSMQQQQQQRMEMAGHPVGHVMGPGVPPRFPGARMGMPPQPQQQQPPQQQQQPQPQQRPMAPGQPQGPRIQFHGHDPNTRLPPDLCLLGCIFYIIDYTEDPDKAKYVPDWKKVIKQFGGEVEEEYHPRLTHILCMTQDNPIVQQAVREGKRLVTTYWLNDTVVRKKVGPPWKAIHFPLPPNFTPPCENMILTLTGFVDRNRDWVKDMIAMTGAKYTSYFSRHNHVIVCQSATGEKYNKSKEWNVPAVSVQWLNDVLFGNGNAEQCMQNPKYHNFKMEDPFRMDYTLVPHLIAAWKNPIRVTPETYNKFKANPPARIKRKAERQRLEKEEAKRLREAEEMRGGMPPNQGYPGQMMPNGMGAQQHQNPMMMQQQQQHHQQQQQMSMGGVPPQMDPNGFNRDQNHSGPGQQSANPGNPQSGEPSKTGEDLNPNALTDKQSKQPIKAEGNETSENKENDASNKFKVVLTGFGPTENDELKALGRVFYLTPSIKPAMQKVQWIIEASGGVVENRRRRDIAQIKEANPPDKDPSYIIICCEHDLHLVADVLKAKLWIFNVELVLSSVIRQQLDFDPSKYLTTTPVTSST